MINIKQTLYNRCQEVLLSKIDELEIIITSINQSKSTETKSSAGDKFETGRAMMQMEEDKITAQLEIAKHTYNKLSNINIEQHSETIRLGSLVKTKLRHYFLTVALGKIRINDETFFCISEEAPIGQQLLGKSIGNTIEFNKIKDKITQII